MCTCFYVVRGYLGFAFRNCLSDYCNFKLHIIFFECLDGDDNFRGKLYLLDYRSVTVFTNHFDRDAAISIFWLPKVLTL